VKIDKMKVLAHAGPAAWLLRTIDNIPLIGAADRPFAAFFFWYVLARRERAV
jgi:hypothetical protein